MWAGRPGPVQLEIPAPVLYATGDPATAPIFASESGRPPLPQPSDAQLSNAADLLAGAKAPVIFAGTGVDRAQANTALIELVELLGCPVIPSMAGRSVVPHDHALYFNSQSPAADELRRNADVLLVVGSRVGNLDVPFDKYWGDPARCRVIHVDIDPRHIGVSRPVALGIVADARATLEGLAASAPVTTPGPRPSAPPSPRGRVPAFIPRTPSAWSARCSAARRCTARTAA
jgi:acetolactate synthase-1/2/3 large subunit